jgi:hypothetical protein
VQKEQEMRDVIISTIMATKKNKRAPGIDVLLFVSKA